MKIEIFFFPILIFILAGCQADPDDLVSESNFLRGVELSENTNKPIFLYFSSYTKMAYHEFHWDLLKSKKILEKLNEEFITIELYVDDNKKIQSNDTLNLYKIGFSKEWKERLKKANTVGEINFAIEIDLFKENSQPLYVIIDSDRTILIDPFGYTGKDKKLFLEKLNEGLKMFKRKKKNEKRKLTTGDTP